VKKLLLIVIDGLTPSTFEAAADSPETPTLAALAAHGRYRRAVSSFPSLTPVCLSSLATGAHPDVHGIPHLVWYSRDERRVVEYGSSFGAMLAAGVTRSIRDSVLNMNGRHLSERAVTVFEAVEDAGLTPAAINFTCYRGRTLHRSKVPGVPPVRGPRRFFFYNLFESDVTGAPLAVRNRAGGTVDGYAAAVARWLVTRDGFDFLVYYLSDYDFASHASGPAETRDALGRSDRAVGAVVDAAGGIDELLDRYAVLLCSDHGQTHVDRPARLEQSFAGIDDVLVTASNRAGMVYRLPGCRHDARALALLLDADPAVEVALFREGAEAVARRDGEELQFAPDDGGWRTSGDEGVLDHPNALERAWAALANPNAGEVIVSAAPGWELSDLGGRHHAGGGSHGSLAAGDSEVPMLAIGLDVEPASITEVAPAVLGHFGIAPPPYAAALHAASGAS
jgi:predicted AlkP superfamily pyrophosphatase or phosphodiesterase